MTGWRANATAERPDFITQMSFQQEDIMNLKLQLRSVLLVMLMACCVVIEPSASRLFSDGSSEKIENQTTAVVTDEPITMACWVWIDEGGIVHTAISVGNPTSNGGFWRVGVHPNSGNPAYSQKQNDGGSLQNSSISATGINLNEWHHIAGTFAADNNTIAYLDGVAATASTTAVPEPAAARTSIGTQSGNLVFPEYFSGRIAEVGIWNAVLTGAEIVSLSKGVAPRRIRPQSLQMYVPLVRDVMDLRKGLALTTTGTTVADHPRVFYGGR